MLDFPRPCQVTRQIRSFTFGNPLSARLPPSACPPVRQPVCSSTHCPPIARPRPLVRPPVRSFAQSPRPPMRPSAHPSARPPTPSAPSASYHPWSLAYKFLAVEAERALCLSMSQDCGFSLEDPLRETHCTGGHPTFVQGHGIVLEYYVVLCLVGSAS